MPGAADRRRRQAQLEQLLRSVRAKEPAAREQEVISVQVEGPSWTTSQAAPGVLVLERAGARLWREGLDGAPALEAEVGPGWSVEFDGSLLRLQSAGRRLALWAMSGAPGELYRPMRHRLVAALERALSPTPDVAPRLAVDRVGPASPGEVVGCGLLHVGVVAGGALWLAHGLRLPWTIPPCFSLLALVALVLLVRWLWSPYQRGRDGWVGLYPDRVVHVQDRLVALPWSAVRGFDDRPSSWIALDCDPPLAIPTVDEPTRTAVLAALDAAGLRRTS